MEKFGLLTFVMILALGVFSRQYVARVTHVPYTVVMMMCGAVVGLVIEREMNGREIESPTIRAWYRMSPEVLLYTFIPILVFESAFMIDTHIFSRIATQILTLAGPGVLVASILTAVFVRFAFVAYNWSWPTCLMFGAIMSATDPVAVVALLKELGVSERLGTLIEGESLLNDGTAIVIFDVFFEALEEAPCEPEFPKPAHIVVLLLRLAALGPVVGAIVGLCCTRLLGFVLNDPFNEITITLLACYASFGVAEGVVGSSGVLSVVCAGMYMSRHARGRISADVEQSMRSFWAVLAHVANTAVFFLSGLIMAVRVFGFRGKSFGDDCVRCGHDHHHHGDEAEDETRCRSFRALDFGYLIILYVALHVIRGIVVLVSSPVLWRGAYGMSVPQASVVVYGGLRGAIGLALALVINETDGIEDNLKLRVLFQVSGIVVLMLCVNATTMRPFLHSLQLDRSSDAEEEIFAHVSVDVEKKISREISRLRREQFFGDADWAMVWRYVPILSADAYWLRLRDGRLQLSDAELADARRAVVTSSSAMASRSRSREYPVPWRLRDRWLEYHRCHGGRVPKFLHLAPGENVRARLRRDASSSPEEVVVSSAAAPTFDEILEAVMLVDVVCHDAEERHDEQPQLERGLTLQHSMAAAVEAASSGGDDDESVRSLENLPSKATTTTTRKRHTLMPANLLRRVLRPKQRTLFPVETTAGTPAVEQPPSSDSAAARGESEDDDNNNTELSTSLGRPRAVRSEARARCMWQAKANYNAAFARGRLSPAGLRALRENVDFQLDDSGRKLDEWERLVASDISRLETLDKLRGLKPYLVLVPPLAKLLDAYVFRQTAFVFELAYNFIKAHGDIDTDELVDDGRDKTEIVAEISRQRRLAKTTVNEYVAIFPDAANAVKTQVAARYVLVLFQRLVAELHEHGAINETELEAASDEINASRIKLDLHPPRELMPSLETTLFRDLKVPFLMDAGAREDLVDLVRDDSRCHSEIALAGKVLARRGRRKLERLREFSTVRYGWFVVVRGSVVARRDDDDDDDDDDVPPTLHAAGAVCCLEEQLLGIPMTATYSTLSLCHLVYVDAEAILAVARDHVALRRRLWFSVATRVLRESPATNPISAARLAQIRDTAYFIEVPDPDDLEDDENENENRRKLRADEHLSRRGTFVRLSRSFRRPSAKQRRRSPEATTDDEIAAIHVEEEEEEADARSSPPDTDNNNSNHHHRAATDSPFCLEATSPPQDDRFGIMTSRSNPSLATLDAPPADDDAEAKTTAATRRGTGKYWAKVRNAVSTAAEMRRASMRRRELNAEYAAVVEAAKPHNVPPGSLLLLLKGCAFIYPRDATQDQNQPLHAAHAIAIITIDDKLQSRQLKLSAGAKAFIIREALLAPLTTNERPQAAPIPVASL
ncbi:hypothetical protein CTAYLR_005573 [Chrysophaeum taylorii]|uniref:Cation/H+ exchanger transmembrane domain-containing protein n=1 Tax=Chrysophaeum taylorii TaxID=2483200 RepID=A0AAD7XGX8_9STRA|nr:hypothetical protein CTAYLR_005573 [Chrysophaeum taylorii]